MAKSYNGSPGGSDAATIKPKFVPDYELQPRDDSGGPDYSPYTAEFGDGGFVQGPKAHLSAHGGKDDAEQGDELAERPRASDKGNFRTESPSETEAPAKSKRESKE